MGDSHIQTTARYLRHRSQASDALLLADAFGGVRVEQVGSRPIEEVQRRAGVDQEIAASQ